MNEANMYGAPRVLLDTDYDRIGPHLIQPFNPRRVQPASYDVTLDRKLLVPSGDPRATFSAEAALGVPSSFTVDLRHDAERSWLNKTPAELMHPWEMGDKGFHLTPGRSVLAATAERVTCPDDMICSVDGKSTLGRCWIAIHATAGFIDPGFKGVVTLEITNHGPWTFVLYPGMPIGQLRFQWLGQSVARPYGHPDLGSHYQDSDSVKAAAP